MRKNEVAKLVTLTTQLSARVADLVSPLHQNSKNSSKPPSSDQKPHRVSTQGKKKRQFRPGASRQLLSKEEVLQVLNLDQNHSGQTSISPNLLLLSDRHQDDRSISNSDGFSLYPNPTRLFFANGRLSYHQIAS